MSGEVHRRRHHEAVNPTGPALKQAAQSRRNGCTIKTMVETIVPWYPGIEIPSRLSTGVCREILIKPGGNLVQPAVQINIQRSYYRRNLLALYRFGLGIEM